MECGVGLQTIEEYRGVDAATFHKTIVPRGTPAVLRGVVGRWRAVAVGQESPRALCNYLSQWDRGGQVLAFVADHGAGGRFWYRPDMRGLNFERITEPFSTTLRRIMSEFDVSQPAAVYTGSVPISEIVPGFELENRLDLLEPSVIARLWIGNRVTVSTHFDMSRNIACVVAGRRRFTLFPPEQVANLYVGPLEFTFAGQPVSMVDLAAPDFERYPRFKEAMETAVQAELGPGDALYIPYMWWHHVESLERFNVLVNYWWDDGRPWLGSPFEAMVLGLLTIGDLPEDQRRIWRAFFDHYVFRPDGRHPAEHFPADSRGIMSKPTPQLAKFVKSWLIRALSG